MAFGHVTEVPINNKYIKTYLSKNLNRFYFS